jgi:hypothetical protein
MILFIQNPSAVWTMRISFRHRVSLCAFYLISITNQLWSVCNLSSTHTEFFSFLLTFSIYFVDSSHALYYFIFPVKNESIAFSNEWPHRNIIPQNVKISVEFHRARSIEKVKKKKNKIKNLNAHTKGDWKAKIRQEKMLKVEREKIWFVIIWNNKHSRGMSTLNNTLSQWFFGFAYSHNNHRPSIHGNVTIMLLLMFLPPSSNVADVEGTGKRTREVRWRKGGTIKV